MPSSAVNSSTPQCVVFPTDSLISWNSIGYSICKEAERKKKKMDSEIINQSKERLKLVFEHWLTKTIESGRRHYNCKDHISNVRETR